MTPAHDATWRATALLLTLLIGLALPWWHGPNAALTLNAYDLAEVLTLRLQGERWLWPALLLRLPFALLPAGLLTRARAQPRNLPRWAVHSVAALGCVIALVPPRSVLRSGLSDPNAAQQALLFVTALCVSAAAVWPRRRWPTAELVVGVVLGGAAAGGLALAVPLLAPYNVAWRVGVGPLVFGVAWMGHYAWLFVRRWGR